jgi:predicted DCC family thiol-disulfide oxidoreductase YuxK
MDVGQPIPRKGIILFDGVCNLCNGFVNFLLDHDKKKFFLFGSLQSQIAQRLLAEKVEGRNLLSSSELILQSVVYIDEHGHYYKESQAIFQIARRLGLPYNFLYLASFLPLVVTDTVYRWVAKNRYRFFGRQEICRIPTEEERGRFLESIRPPEKE